MSYSIKIQPIATDIEIWKHGFATERDAMAWIQANNCPVVDYEIVQDQEKDKE